jgi:hypothetical protein
MTLSIPPRPIQANASDVRSSARADTNAARQSSEPVGVVAGGWAELSNSLRLYF